MGFFLFVITMIVVVKVLNKLFPIPDPSKRKTECPPHVWVYGEDGFLYCKVCSLKPGYSGRE